MNLNDKIYVAVDDEGVLYGAEGGPLIASSIESLKFEVDTWSFMMPDYNVRLVPVKLVPTGDPSIPWSKSEAEERRKKLFGEDQNEE